MSREENAPSHLHDWKYNKKTSIPNGEPEGEKYTTIVNIWNTKDVRFKDIIVVAEPLL